MDPALPPALTDHVGYLAVVLGQRSQARFEEAMESIALRPIHYDYLATLAASGPMAQKELARLLEVDAARIVALTDELADRDLVTREVDIRDRRRNLLSLTRAGRTLTQRADGLAADVQDHLVRGLSAREVQQLRSLLKRVLSQD